MELNKIYTFKLNSGEEIIAKIVGDGPKFIVIQNPVSVAPNGKGIGLIPSLFTADINGEAKLNINSVSVYAETDESIQTKYIEITTGISIPDKKILVG
jgi:hypothetical protein